MAGEESRIATKTDWSRNRPKITADRTAIRRPSPPTTPMISSRIGKNDSA